MSNVNFCFCSSQPQPSAGGRPFSPYAPGFSGVPPGGASGVPPPPTQPQPGQPIDPNMAAFHQHQVWTNAFFFFI